MKMHFCFLFRRLQVLKVFDSDFNENLSTLKP